MLKTRYGARWRGLRVEWWKGAGDKKKPAVAWLAANAGRCGASVVQSNATGDSAFAPPMRIDEDKRSQRGGNPEKYVTSLSISSSVSLGAMKCMSVCFRRPLRKARS